MATVSRFAFLLFFVAAFLLWGSARPAHRLLAYGFAALGLDGVIGLLVRSHLLGFETASVLGTLTWLTGLGLIVLAASRLASADGAPLPLAGAAAPRLRTYLNPAETPMESLVIPRNATNSFTRAETLRDQLYDRVEQACRQAGLEAVGYKSPAQSGVVWARFDFALPQDTENLTLRAGLRLTVERFDYHRFEHLLTLELFYGTRRKTIGGLIELREDDLRGLIGFLTGGPTAVLLSRRVRRWPWELWHPANKVERLGPDWLTVGLVPGLLVLFIIPRLGPLLALAGLVGYVVYNRKRNTYVLTTGKPLHDPRQLVRMDSWQATVNQLGSRHQEIRQALLDRLRTTAAAGVQVEPERIWYPGVDGKVEREQIVCSFRRAVGFVHLERYGDDLYVGWDTHVNGATWVEQTLARGVDRQSRKLVVANRVAPGWQTPNEYDLTDVNFLTEWMHAAITKLVRRTMEEVRIDQEIDFTIQRESRRDALGAARPAEPGAAPSGLAGFASRLRRVG